MDDLETFTAFAGHTRLVRGSIEAVARDLSKRGVIARPVLILSDMTGHPVDLDLSHGAEHAAAEYRSRSDAPVAPPRQGRGRPKLGVVAREVTLLPRHWDWLATQPGGASAALRRLVEDARRANAGPDRERQARDALYRAMSALAGDLPGFEEASRALFANDRDRFGAIVAAWPTDVAAHLQVLAEPR